MVEFGLELRRRAFLRIIRVKFFHTDCFHHLCDVDWDSKECCWDKTMKTERMGGKTEEKSFRVRREEYQKYPHGYYHLCTDGWQGGNLFNRVEQFVWGMATMALVALKFKVVIYSFELMSNHIHIILSATGEVCVELFDFIVRRIRKRLRADGDPQFPDDYGFKLVPIESPEALLRQFLYTARNPYERGYSVPGGYMWGSDYLVFNQIGQSVQGDRVDSLPVKKVWELIGSREKLPGRWEVHPEFGVLPRNYVRFRKVEEMFGSPKEYVTRLVKDYESLVYAAKELGEDGCLTVEEEKELVRNEVTRLFQGRDIGELSTEEKYRMVTSLCVGLHLSEEGVAKGLGLPERVVRQVLTSKDFGVRRLRNDAVFETNEKAGNRTVRERHRV